MIKLVETEAYLHLVEVEAALNALLDCRDAAADHAIYFRDGWDFKAGAAWKRAYQAMGRTPPK